MKIGLVGEAPTDTRAVHNLLKKKYNTEDFSFFSLLKRINGCQLENQKTKRLLRLEYEKTNPDIIIFIRDLDAIQSDRQQILKRKLYFRDFNSVVDRKGCFLLHIFEIEAMILADIDAFNKKYSTNIIVDFDVMDKEDPKGFLLKNCKSYTVCSNDEIFDLLDFETLKENCLYFARFIKDFDKLLEKKIS